MARASTSHDDTDDEAAPAGKVRLDKWLWAARFFKTRAMAADAIDGGKVSVNDDRPKRARLITAGDVVSIRIQPYEHIVAVLDVSARRGSAVIAQALYQETAASVEARARVQVQQKSAAIGFSFQEGKPSKKERRAIDRVRHRR